MNHYHSKCHHCEVTFIRGKQTCKNCKLLFCDKCINKELLCPLCMLRTLFEYNRVVPSKPIKIPTKTYELQLLEQI